MTFDRWFSEQSLYDSGRVQQTIDHLKKQGHVYEKDGALWFRTEAFGDEKDRVVVRSNGLTTYFASDIAYHQEKYERGFDRVIDVWGADHHGYINRMGAAVMAMGYKREQFQVILVQLVNLMRGGKPVQMSTRAGEFVTLKDIVDEVGKDAARFMFLSRSYDSGLDFDLEVAKQKSSDNPVYYVQYVHARIAGILAKAEDRQTGAAMDFSQGRHLSKTGGFGRNPPDQNPGRISRAGGKKCGHLPSPCDFYLSDDAGIGISCVLQPAQSGHFRYGPDPGPAQLGAGGEKSDPERTFSFRCVCAG